MAVNALQVRAEISFHTLPGRHADDIPDASFWFLQQTCPIASVEQSLALITDLQLSAAGSDLLANMYAVLVSVGAPAGRCWRCWRTILTSAPWPWSCARRRRPQC